MQIMIHFPSAIPFLLLDKNILSEVSVTIFFTYLYGDRMPGGGEFLVQLEMSVLSDCPLV